VFVWLTRESVKDDEISYLIEMSGILLSKHTPNAVRTATRSPPNAPKVWAGKDKTPQHQMKGRNEVLIQIMCLFYSKSVFSMTFSSVYCSSPGEVAWERWWLFSTVPHVWNALRLYSSLYESDGRYVVNL
jgi:hypothetical protein